jgi:hypothetical protein
MNNEDALKDDLCETFCLTVQGVPDERRIDQWLVHQLPELTRSRIQSLAKQGFLTLEDGAPVKKLSSAPILVRVIPLRFHRRSQPISFQKTSRLTSSMRTMKSLRLISLRGLLFTQPVVIAMGRL